MPYGMYLSADGALAQMQRMNVIANNMANVDTVGFKRDLAVVQARYSEAIEQGLADPGAGGQDDVGGGVRVRETRTEFAAQGSLRPTGSGTDAAIVGEGFFLVRKGEQNYLTRSGNFTLLDGVLQTQQGHTVLDASGSPVAIDPLAGPVAIDGEGALVQDGTRIPLAMVRPADMNELKKAGENTYRPQSEPIPVEPTQRRVKGGYLEMSSVKPTTEMLDMIEASRAFEANVQLIRQQDQLLEGLVSRMIRVR